MTTVFSLTPAASGWATQPWTEAPTFTETDKSPDDHPPGS
jgi:hypothetical protein